MARANGVGSFGARLTCYLEGDRVLANGLRNKAATNMAIATLAYQWPVHKRARATRTAMTIAAIPSAPWYDRLYLLDVSNSVLPSSECGSTITGTGGGALGIPISFTEVPVSDMVITLCQGIPARAGHSATNKYPVQDASDGG